MTKPKRFFIILHTKNISKIIIDKKYNTYLNIFPVVKRFLIHIRL